MQQTLTRSDVEARIFRIASDALEKTDGRNESGQSPKGEMKAHGRVIEIGDFDLSDPLLEAKRDIFWLLMTPELDIIGPVVASVSLRDNLSGYMRDVLRDRLSEILEHKTMSDPPKGLDLQRIVDGASPVAWAKTMVENSAHPTTVSRLKYATLRNAIPITEETEVLLPTTAIPESMEFEMLVDDIAGDVKYQRERSRLKIAADAIRKAYQLPLLETSPSMADRTTLLDELAADMRLAHIALQYRIELGDSLTVEALDDTLLQVPPAAVLAWSWYELPQAERIFDLDPLVAHIILSDALSLDPRPGRNDIRRVKSMLRLASSKPGWLAAIFPAFDAFLDSRYEPENERSSAGPRIMASETEYREAMLKVVLFQGNPMNVSSVPELDGKMYRLVSELLSGS